MALQHPSFSFRSALCVEAVGGLPQVFEDRHEILNHHDVRSVARNRRFDFPLLSFLAIDPHQPRSLLLGVTTLGFGEPFLDHFRGSLTQAGPHPLVLYFGPLRRGRLVLPQDLLGCPQMRGHLVSSTKSTKPGAKLQST